jgi:L-seryl-tRNA(Ser) seleniumtransferase
VRVDKLMLAALEPIIAAYAHAAYDDIPALRELRASVAELTTRAERWRADLGALADRTEIVSVESVTGGGTLGSDIPSVALAVSTRSPDAFARALRDHDPPVVARIEDGRVLLDPRTVLPGEDASVVSALARALSG